MTPIVHREAALTLADAEICVLASRWPRDLDFTFSAPRHLFAMYFSSISGVEGRYLEQDETHFAPTGSIFFRPAGRRLNIRGPGRSPVRAVHCLLDQRRLDVLGAGGLQWSPQALQAALDIRAPNLRPHFLRLASEAASPGIAAPLVADAVLVLMVSELLDYLSPAPRSGPGPGDVAARVLRRVRDRIYDGEAPPPTVTELADLCGLSERHLLRLFRRAQGVSLIDFVREARLERAMELLSATDLPLKAVAHRLGFSSHASFTAAFTREAGVAPTVFRRDRRRPYVVRALRDDRPAKA